MSAVLGEIIVIAALIAVVGLIVRSLVKKRRTGGGCTGNCACCRGCH